MSVSRRWVSDAVFSVLSVDSGQGRQGLVDALDYTSKQVGRGLQVLRNRGWVRLDGRLWFLTKAGLDARESGRVVRAGGKGRPRGIKTPKKRTFRQRAWAELRRSGKVTIPELLLVLDAGESKRRAHNLEEYFLRLEQVGILTRLRRRAKGGPLTSPGHVVWVIPEDPGPKAPIWRSTKSIIHDPNSGKDYPIEGRQS
ncbi:MAG: hypothetical protein HQL52_19930 [Magnetococcales bacterium]|nr:hypothetical protein [Magnetococcales bacterium]